MAQPALRSRTGGGAVVNGDLPLHSEPAHGRHEIAGFAVQLAPAHNTVVQPRRRLIEERAGPMTTPG